MPQLMPLMWIMSIFMVSLILMVMVDLFFYSVMDSICMNLFNEVIIDKSYLW